MKGQSVIVSCFKLCFCHHFKLVTSCFSLHTDFFSGGVCWLKSGFLFLKDCCLECFHLNLEVSFHLNLFPDLMECEYTKVCRRVQLREDRVVPSSSNLSLRVFQVAWRPLLRACRIVLWECLSLFSYKRGNLGNLLKQYALFLNGKIKWDQSCSQILSFNAWYYVREGLWWGMCR